MKKSKRTFANVLLAGMLVTLASCSSNELAEGGMEIPEAGEPQLSITVGTPASEGVIFRSVQATRATVADEDDESTINTLNVYLFKKGEGDADTDYTFYKQYTFGDGGENGTLGDGGSGKKTCSIDIDPELMDATVKLALIANDKPTAPVLEAGTTTLDAFKKGALATATVEAGNKADALVGGEEKKSFPMSAVSGDVKLTPLGATTEATLVRNVARIDVFNYTPNLTITKVSVTQANDKSYLFGGESEALNVPSGQAPLNLEPLKEFADRLSSDGLAFVTPEGEEEHEEDDYRAVNSYRMFYLYEQSVTDGDTSPMLTIEYMVELTDNSTKPGSVTVMFRTGADPEYTYKNVARNTLYTIKLGDGTVARSAVIKHKLVVEDWTIGDEINSGLKPSGEENPGE